MPQLPSGRHVGISPDNILDFAKKCDFQQITNFYMHIHDRNMLLHLLHVVLYKDNNNPPLVEQPIIGNPYISDLVVTDIDTTKCNWSSEDKAAFSQWLQEERTQDYLQSIYDKLFEILKANKSPPPAALHGIFEDE